MSPSRGTEGLPVSSVPAHVGTKRQRTLSFRLDDAPLPQTSAKSRSSSIRRNSEARVKRSRRASSSASSFTPDTEGERAGPVASTSQQTTTGSSVLNASPELADDLPLPTSKPAPMSRRSGSLRAHTLDSLGRASSESAHGRRPQSVARSFTMQPARAAGWEESSSAEDERRAPSPRRNRERARSLHSHSKAYQGQPSPKLNGQPVQSASSPGLASRSYFGASALRKDVNQSSASSDARPASPVPRSVSFEGRRRSSRDVRRKHSQSRARPLSETVLPNSTTHGSLADVASYAPAASPPIDPTPAPREPTLRELIESVPLEQALSLYQSVNRGTQRALHESAGRSFVNGVRPTSPLSQEQSVESAPTSQKHLLADSEPHSSPEKEKREKKRSLGLHFGSAKSRKTLKEMPSQSDMLALTPTLTNDRALRSPGERAFDDLIARAHLQTSPVTFARANECRAYIEAKYNPIFLAINEHRPPPNLVDVSRWRSRAREEQMRMHGLAMSSSSVRASPLDVPLVAGKALPHRNKRTRDFEVYPDETLAYLEAANSPKQSSPSIMQSIVPGRRRQSTFATSEGSDHLPPLPRRDESYASSIYGTGRMSDRGSSVSLPTSRHRSPSVSSAHGNINGGYRASPPASPRQILSSMPHSVVSSPRQPASGNISRIGSVKANLARTFRHRERSNQTGHRSAGSGSDVPFSPYLSETDQSDVEQVARLRHSGSKADSLARRGWRNFRGQTDHLHRIEHRESGGQSILGGPISDGDTMADLGSLLEEEPVVELKPPLPVLDIDDEEEERLNDLLAQAQTAVSRASAFAPRCPAKIASYLTSLDDYDLATRVSSRQLNMPALVLPRLPHDIAIEVQRASRAERILRPSQHLVEEDDAPETNKFYEEPESESGSSGSVTDSEESEKRDAVPTHLASREQTWPTRRGPLRRQSLAGLHGGLAQQPNTAGARQRRMTVATEHPQKNLAMGIRPDPLPGVMRTVQAFEQLLVVSMKDATAGAGELNDFFMRVSGANRSAGEHAAELGGSTQELSHLAGIMDRSKDGEPHGQTERFFWQFLAGLLEALLRLIALTYTVVRILLIPLRVLWAIVVVCSGHGGSSRVD